MKTVVARTELESHTSLREKDNPVAAARAGAGSTSSLRAKRSEIILFTTQLSVMLESGVVLSDALEAIAAQARHGVFKLVIVNIADRIKNGESFSDSLACYPRIFDTMFVSMVRASEASGTMAQMLDVLSGYQNADSETRKQIKAAMIYPVVMFFMAVAATGSLMFFVLPRFAKIYETRGAALPKLTQMLVGFSKLLGNAKIMSVVTVLSATLATGIYLWKRTPGGRRTIDWCKVHMPIFGKMFIDAVMTRSMRILATMVSSGVSLLDALEVVQMSCGNYYFQQLWSSVNSRIRDGYQFSEAILLAPNNRLVAPGIIQMLRAGEKSGQLGRVCDKISVFYEKKLQNSIKTATALIEPLMIVIMGCIIGTIAIALLLPVFRISTILAH